jgi:hypothetical protein
MATDRIVIQGSARPFVAAASSAVTLGGLGLTVLRTAGPGTVSVGLLLGAALALAVLLADLPLRTEGDEEGLVRVCILRHGRIPWDRVVAIERQSRRLTGPGTGGLVIRGRRGRWLVATSAEPPAIHRRLAELVAAHAPGVRMLADAPAVATD